MSTHTEMSDRARIEKGMRQMLNGLTEKELVFLAALREAARDDLAAAKQMASKWLKSSRSQAARSRRHNAMRTVKRLFS